MTAKINKLLIVKMSAIGDVLMSLPALMALKKTFPQMEVDWLVEAPADALLLDHPLLNKIIISPRKKLAQLLKKAKIKEAQALARFFLKELRQTQYDAILDLQGLFKSAAMLALAKGQRKIGFAETREKTSWALNEKMPAYDPERHAALRYLDAARYLGAEASNEPPTQYYFPSPHAIKEARNLFKNATPYLILNPGARWLSKCWPLDSWVKLASLLTEKTSFQLFITGGKEEFEMGELISKSSPGKISNLCGLTSLPVLAALLEKAEMTISADTGPMHLAAAVGGGGLALFSPTKPTRTGPFGGSFKIMTAPVECLGCLKKKCRKINCMGLINPEDVLANALAYMNGKNTNED